METTSLKVLSLEPWMLRMHARSAPQLKTTDPVFNRNGYYMQGDECWFEVNGLAYNYDPESFKYTLKRLSMEPLRECEAKAVETLAIANMAPMELCDRLQNQKMNEEVRKSDAARKIRLAKLKLSMISKRDI